MDGPLTQWDMLVTVSQHSDAAIGYADILPVRCAPASPSPLCIAIFHEIGDPGPGSAASIQPNSAADGALHLDGDLPNAMLHRMHMHCQASVLVQRHPSSSERPHAIRSL